MTPKKVLKTINLINIDLLWAWKNVWGYGRKVHAKFWPWGMPWDLFYGHFWVLCRPSFIIFGILKYVRVYEGIWGYMDVGKVYEGV